MILFLYNYFFRRILFSRINNNIHIHLYMLTTYYAVSVCVCALYGWVAEMTSVRAELQSNEKNIHILGESSAG